MKMQIDKITEDVFKPDYEKLSLVNVSNSILAHFGCRTLHPVYPFEKWIPGLFDNINKVIIFLIDALGLHSLQRVLRKEDFFDQKNILYATSVFPTTTSASISSLLTATTPIEHGILGYILYLKEVGALVNMIELSSPTLGKVSTNFASKEILLSETIFEKILTAGVKGCVLTSKNIRSSGFSNLIHTGASIKSYQSFGDLFFKLKEILQEDGKVFGFVYWGLLDSIGHKMGVDSEAFENELYWLLKMIQKQVIPFIENDTLLMIMGDHGQIATPWENEIWWSWKDEISTFFTLPPGGEMRMMHIYTRQPREVIEYIREIYSDKAMVLTRDEAIQMRLFGDTHCKKESLERIGDIILIARWNYSFYFKFTGREESLKSKHGGLSLDELIVPLILFRR